MKCKFTDCGRDARTAKYGLCSGHEYQFKNNKPLAPLREYRKSDIGLDGYRRCNNCDEIKKVSEFYKRTGACGYYSRCKVCHNVTQEAQNGD